MLFAASRPLANSVRHLLERMRGEFGGRIVEPLHVTLERTDGEDPRGLAAAVREHAPHTRPVAVRGENLLITPSPYRGGDVLKLQVAHSEPLRRESDAVRSAIRAAGLRSLYGDDRSTTVTVLERVDRHGPLDQSRWTLPVDLFMADELIVSRIVDASTYDILDRVAI